MHAVFLEAVRTLGQHVGAAAWALAVFACGFLLAFLVVRFDVRSLLAFPLWLMRVARRHLRPETNALLLCSFIFAFNAAAIFVYMMSGGLVVLPIVFDLFTGLNIGVILLKEGQEAAADPPSEPEPPGTAAPAPPARAWVGFLGLFVIVVELSSFWLAIGMGMRLGYSMRAEFAWPHFVQAAEPVMRAYALILVPALAASAAAETITIKAMMARSPDESSARGER